jgi:hypothetical protein
MPDNSFNPRAERASSNFDVRQRLQWYWTYNLPKVHTQRSWIERLGAGRHVQLRHRPALHRQLSL